MEEEKINYEIAYLVKNEADKERILKFFDSLGIKLNSTGEPKLMTLAYPIKKEKTAFFGWYDFSAEPENISQLEKNLKLDQQIIRFLIVKLPKISKKETRPKSQNVSKESSLKRSMESQNVLTNEDLEQRLKEILK